MTDSTSTVKETSAQTEKPSTTMEVKQETTEKLDPGGATDNVVPMPNAENGESPEDPPVETTKNITTTTTVTSSNPIISTCCQLTDCLLVLFQRVHLVAQVPTMSIMTLQHLQLDFLVARTVAQFLQLLLQPWQ